MRIATPDDINKAVMLGLAYPKGPLEFGDLLGRENSRHPDGDARFLCDPRYRLSRG